MTSLKARMFGFMVRNGHLLQGRLRKEVFDFNTSIPAFRERCEKGASRFAKLPKGISIRAQTIEGMNSEWHTPDGTDAEKLILYVHGGGYVSGSCNDHRGFVSKFANFTGITNLIYEYRLAPEHPFPAALEDSVRIYKWLLANAYKPQNIIIAGESAGGGLALALLLALKEENIDLPAAAVVISPWTDLTCSSDSYRTKNKLSPAPLNSWTVFSKYYVAENQVRNPLISPLFGDLQGLPPIFINSAMNDELYDDGVKFAETARLAGVDVTFRAGTGMLHCYPLLAPMFPEATEAMNEIVEFTKKHLKLNS
jgi:epsilon-lactone hydrolase